MHLETIKKYNFRFIVFGFIAVIVCSIVSVYTGTLLDYFGPRPSAVEMINACLSGNCHYQGLANSIAGDFGNVLIYLLSAGLLLQIFLKFKKNGP